MQRPVTPEDQAQLSSPIVTASGRTLFFSNSITGKPMTLPFQQTVWLSRPVILLFIWQTKQPLNHRLTKLALRKARSLYSEITGNTVTILLKMKFCWDMRPCRLGVTVVSEGLVKDIFKAV